MKQNPAPLSDDPATPRLEDAIHLFTEGNSADAEAMCRRIVQADPQHHQAIFFLGTIVHQAQRYTEAIQIFLQAIDRQPTTAAYYIALAESLKEQGSLDDALDCFHAVLEIDPDNTDALNGIGVALLKKSEYEKAINAFERVIGVDPAYVEAHANLGGALAKVGAFDRSIESSLAALRIDPQFIPAYNNLAFANVRLKNFTEAVGFYEEALRLDPSDAFSHFHASIPFLASGQYARGWEEYEWRLYKSDYMKLNPRTLEERLWTGEALEGKTVLVWSEQGIGDTLQFIRYLPLLRARAASVIFECPSEVRPLLRNFPGIDRLIERKSEETIEYDFQIPLLSLPKYFGTTLETIPAQIPYIGAPPESIRKFVPLCSAPAFKIGIVWSGGSAFKENGIRSCTLAHFESIVKTSGAAFFSLQKGEAETQLEAAPWAAMITPLGGMFGNFADTAGALDHLDLIITVDTSVAHLAGAMGKTVWLLLMHSPDWRWYATETWYPTMRPFMQPAPGDWTSVFERIEEELPKLLKTL